MGEFRDLLEEEVGKKWTKGIGIFLGIVAVYLVISFFANIFPFSLITKTVNAKAVIQNYEWFYDQYNQIQAQEANIEVLPPDASERPGMSMVLNRAIAEYNSKSRMITRNLWKADDLPYQIELGRE